MYRFRAVVPTDLMIWTPMPVALAVPLGMFVEIVATVLPLILKTAELAAAFTSISSATHPVVTVTPLSAVVDTLFE